MKRFQVSILPAAESDIEGAYAWIAGHDESTAIRWYHRLIAVIYSLDGFPERCPLAPESKSSAYEIREILHGRRQHKYRMLFTVNENKVHLLHVRHGSRRALGETEPAEA